MADIVHAFVCVFYAARYLNIAPAVMGLYQKVSGTAPLLAALKGRFRLFTFSPFDENTTISFFFFTASISRHDAVTFILAALSPSARCGRGLKLLSERPSVEPCYHVQDEEVPILEPPVQHRLAILRQIILMEGSEALKIPAEEYDCLPCQEACLGGVSVPEEPTEDEIVDTYPYRPLPRRGVAARLRVVHLLERGEGAHTGWTAEEGGIQILPRDNLLRLLWCGYACPQGP